MGLLNALKRHKPAKPTAAAAAEPVVKDLPPPPTEVAAPLTDVPPSPAELRQKLFDAIARGDEEQLAFLCHAYRDHVKEYLSTWMIVPESLRSNPAAAEWYTRGLVQLREMCPE